MFEGTTGAMPTCAVCRQAWDPVSVVTLLARHVPSGDARSAGDGTPVGAAAHELAQQIVMAQAGKDPVMRVPLGSPVTLMWLGEYLRLVRRQLVLLQQGNPVLVGDTFDRHPIRAVVLPGGVHVLDVSP